MYTVIEGVDSVVTLTLFRTGNTNLTGAVNLTTIFDTANGM